MKAFSTALIVIVFAAAIAAASTKAVSFSSVEYAEFFCGTALPTTSRPSPAVRPPHKGPVTVDVSITGFVFDPPDLTINVGDTVRWTNNDGTSHSTTSDTGVWDSGLFVTGTFSFTFTGGGSFPYHCSRHPSMTALITVNGGSTPTDTPTNTATNTPTGTPTETPTNTPTPEDTPSVSGTIFYGNAIGNPAPPRFIKNVSVADSAGSPPVGPVITGLDGQYTLTGFGSGEYRIRPTKPGGPNGAITSNDAARVAQGVSGALPFVSQNQRFASDTSGNGAVSSQDAAFIARFAAGLTGVGNTGQWRFFCPPGAPSPLPTPGGTPLNSCATMTVPGPITGVDLVGLLVGEASGNYNTATHPRPVGGGQLAVGGGPQKGIAISLPQVVAADNEIVVPLSVEGAADKGIVSYEFDLRYDPAVIQPQIEPADLKGTVSRGLMVVTNPYVPGLLRVVVYGPMPIKQDGVLMNLRFMLVGTAGANSLLTFERIMFNEGERQVAVSDGRVELF